SSTMFAPRSASIQPSNPYGLKSRSPFVYRSPSTFSRAGSVVSRAGSVGRIASPSASGHALYPFTSTIPRGSSSFNLSLQAQSSNGQKRSYSEDGGPALSEGYARHPSPLHTFGSTPGRSNDNERARKRQLLWDPVQGLVSREAMERAADRAKEALPVPKDEADRILEVLEGMGRTPLGEARRKKPKINVPTPTVPTPIPNPYSRREPTSSQSQRPGTGLNSVFRAREERRQAEREKERARREEEEREIRAREDEEYERAIAREDEEMEEARRRDVPRRKTRSMAAGTPAKEKAASSKAKAKPTPSKAKGKGRARRDSEVTEIASDREESQMDSRLKSSSSRRVKSPTPRMASPPPPSPPTTAPAVAPPEPVKAVTHSTSSSLRPGRTHTSRTHVSSSKVFSAREEDLPPVDDDELDKIKMPMFPPGFSFDAISASSTVTPAAPLAPVLAPVLEKKVPATVTAASVASASSSIFGRMGAPPPSAATPSPFSFGAINSTTSAPTPSLFGSAPSAPVSTNLGALTVPKATPTAASDFFSKPNPTPLSSSTSSGTSKPSFFHSVLENSVTPTPASPAVTPAAPSPFSFGAPTIKPTEVIAPSEVVTPSAAAAPNPFASFGKPIAELVKDDKSAPTAQGIFGNTSSAPSSSLFGEPSGATKSMFGAQEVKAPTSSAAPSLFGGAAASSAPSFSFGSTPTTVVSEEPKKAVPAPSPFTFGAPASTTPPSTAATPTFSITKPSTVEATNHFSGFGQTPLIEEADEDTGMEEEAPSPPKAAAPSSFSFGGTFPATNGSTSPAPSANGTSSFTFGALSSTAPANPSPFGATPAAAAASPFGGSTTPTHFGGFGSGQSSPAPQSNGGSGFFGAQTSSAPIFGAQTSSAPVASMFGAASTQPSNPFGSSSGGSIFGQSVSAPNLAFGGSSAAPAAQPFGNVFGSSSGAPPMSQTMSAPAFGATPSNVPSFGATSSATPSPFGAPSATPSFAFGQNPSNSPAPVSPFAFGAPAPSSGGFSFGAGAGSAPPVFGAPAPAAPAIFGASSSVPGSPAGGGLFNLGSGGDESQSPGKRVIRPMRRKK
ncbi:hypothetical protein P7C70_g5582, partial [Phenoliferia sp. Uapishka_3]